MTARSVYPSTRIFRIISETQVWTSCAVPAIVPSILVNNDVIVSIKTESACVVTVIWSVEEFGSGDSNGLWS